MGWWARMHGAAAAVTDSSRGGTCEAQMARLGSSALALGRAASPPSAAAPALPCRMLTMDPLAPPSCPPPLLVCSSSMWWWTAAPTSPCPAPTPQPSRTPLQTESHTSRHWRPRAAAASRSRAVAMWARPPERRAGRGARHAAAAPAAPAAAAPSPSCGAARQHALAGAGPARYCAAPAAAVAAALFLLPPLHRRPMNLYMSLKCSQRTAL